MTNQTLIEDLTLIPIPSWYQNPWIWLSIGAVIAVGAYLVRRYLKSRPVAFKPFTPERPGPPPHLEALKRLEELRARHAQINAYQVAVECSDILRRYIERRFASPIRFQTTREFLGAIHSSSELSGDSRDELGDFLNFFDDIKFAQQSAEAARTSEAIDGAERFVRRCIPADVTPSPQ